MENFLNEVSKNWIKIDKPEKGCVVAMSTEPKHPKLITHFGIMIDTKKMLHTLQKMNSHLMDIDNPRVKTTIKGFYKWQN